MSIEDIKQIMDGFDPAALLPDLSNLPGIVELVCRIAVLVGPALFIFMAVTYLIAPREANYYMGYRCFFAMGSQDAWCFCQWLAAAVWGLLGIILVLVMLGKTNGFRELPVMEQLEGAISCIFWEGVWALIATVAINLTMAVLFNFKGIPRFRAMRKE